MVKRIESQYQHGNAVYYFETDDRSVKILDENNNELGTLDQLAFNGKPVTGGDFKDIQHTGIYKVKGLSGLPNNIPADQECMLSVQSIGNGLRLYRLIAPNGIIIENTVAGNSQSGWGSGGIGLRNTIDSINHSLGSINDLQTENKNLTAAINEVLAKAKADQTANNNRLEKLENKNFDSRYLMQTGGKMTGNVVMRNGYAYQFETSKGLTADLGYMDDHDKVHVGAWNYPLELNGKGDLIYNGAKVFTDQNAGKGSGLDADKLDGLDSNAFVHTSGSDTKYGPLQLYESRLDFKLKDGDDHATGLTFTNKDNKVVSEILVTGIGDIRFNPGGKNFKTPPFTFDQLRNFVQYGGAHVIRSAEPNLNFQTWDEDTGEFDSGVGFFKPSWDSGSLAVGNWNTRDVVAQFAFGKNHEAVRLAHSPYIGEHNRRLFLQDEQPTGEIPYGSIWIGI